MKLLGNAVVLVVGVLVLALVTVVLLAPETLERLFAGISDVNIALRTVAMIVVNMLVLVLIYLRLRRQPTSVKGLTVQVQGVLANVEVESARAIVLHAVSGVTDVRSADATVRSVQGRADVEVDVTIASASVNVPEKQKEINQVLRQVITKQLGLRFHGRPRVNIRLETPLSAPGSDSPEKPSVVVTPAVQPDVQAASLTASEAEPLGMPAAPAADIKTAAEADTGAVISAEPITAVSEQSLDPTASDETGLNDDWLRSHLRNEAGEKEKDNNER